MTCLDILFLPRHQRSNYTIVLSKYKPAASRKTLLLLAALFWTVIGFILLLRGSIMLVDGRHFISLAIALVVGTLKGVMVFEKSAKKNIVRILSKEEGSCLGAVFSFKSWGLILVMILFGRLLRTAGYQHIYGFVVSAVGCGLLLACRVIWQKWKNMPV